MAECDHSIGYLTKHYSSDEGAGSRFDLATEFITDDEQYAIYLSHHQMTKEIRMNLGNLATGMKNRIEQLQQEGEA